MTVSDDGSAGAAADGELRCSETLPVGDPEHVVREVFEDLENAPLREDLPEPSVEVRYRPVVDVEAVTRATFEADGEVVHRIEARDHVVLEADDGNPRLAPDGVVDLVGVQPVPLADVQDEWGGDAVRFDGDEETYREWATERLCDALAETISYEGRDGETYTTECRPSAEDVSLRTVQPVYLPRVEAAVEVGEYVHRYTYDAAAERHVVHDDGIRRCDHCETAGAEAATYTHCENCGSIACDSHTETERLTGEPVCTGCAVTEEYLLSTKYFFDEANAETFAEAYESMPVHRKPMENPHLVAGAGAALCLVGLLAVVAVL